MNRRKQNTFSTPVYIVVIAIAFLVLAVFIYQHVTNSQDNTSDIAAEVTTTQLANTSSD